MLNRTTPIILTEIRGSISSWRRLSNRNGNLRLSLTRHLANGRNTCKWPTVLTTKLTDWKVSQTRLNPRSIATPELEVPRLWTLHTRISRSYFKRLRTKTLLCTKLNKWKQKNVLLDATNMKIHARLPEGKIPILSRTNGLKPSGESPRTWEEQKRTFLAGTIETQQKI